LEPYYKGGSNVKCKTGAVQFIRSEGKRASTKTKRSPGGKGISRIKKHVYDWKNREGLRRAGADLENDGHAQGGGGGGLGRNSSRGAGALV